MSFNMKSAFYNGLKYVDIDDKIDLPTDFETGRIPNKGDILCFQSIVESTTTQHHCIVLFVYQTITGFGEPIEIMDISSNSIYVITKKINPELGEETWQSINKIINDKI